MDLNIDRPARMPWRRAFAAWLALPVALLPTSLLAVSTLNVSTFAASALAVSTFAASALAASTGANITTYHGDNLRTGWNPAETQLTPASIAAGFGLQQQISLDEQVDAQPLFVSGLHIAGGTHDVVFVATENNSIYAIDANSGAILLQNNYGTAVPYTSLPGQCNNNSANVGINSTPVIDLATNTIYAITYTQEAGAPVFRLHAISLTTLADKQPSIVITASNSFKNGKTVTFDPTSQRQRPGLLESNGTIYAGFGSFCDFNANSARGWVLGWQASTLAPLSATALLNRQARSRDDFFLSSVWMSGYGIASDDQNGLFFVTGNSDYSGTTYNSTYNIAESVVNLSADLTTVRGFYTPTGPNGWSSFDKSDADFGAGGVLMLPPQAGSYPHLAVAAGKAGPMVLLNRDSLGGVGRPNKVTLGTYPNYGCWCGPSYFVGGDGVGRVVESTGNNVLVWTVQTSPSSALVYESSSPGVNSDQDPGFFTSISSNGTQANTAVIWAVARPNSGDPNTTVYLQAYDPANGAASLLGNGLAAGTWPFAGNANANLVPVAANGHVFVASYQQLSIFGLTTPGARKVGFKPALRPAAPAAHLMPHALTGMVERDDGQTLSLRLRNGTLLQVAYGAALQAYHGPAPELGHALTVRGDYRRDGTLVAAYLLHAKPAKGFWAADY